MRKKVAVVTGSSRGIGKTVAEELLKSGYKVITIARSSTVDYSLDVSDSASVAKCFKDLVLRYQSIDVLVNAAGKQGPIGSFVDNNLAQWGETLKVNLLGTVYCCREFIQVASKNGASIINFSGGGGLTARANFSAYAASKAAVVRLTETLAEELAPLHIRVNAVSPGGVNTYMFEQMLAAGEKLVGKTEWEKLQKQKELGGNDPHLVADLCLWLASSQSEPLSGKTVSAIYDDWQNWTPRQIKKLVASDWLTLRRLDRFVVNKLEKI